MTKLVIAGAGKIGAMIAQMLLDTGDYTVTVADRDAAALDLIGLPDVTCKVADMGNEKDLRSLLRGQDVVISACPYFLNTGIARMARECGVHYFDLTEDVETTRAIRAMAEGADIAFMPQCGLAPGFIGIAAYSLAQSFDDLDSVAMRVGALPKFPTNRLKYNLTWSTDGLINEYCNPCEAIYEGQKREVLPLEGYEMFSLDGVNYEAFNTSGGLGTLCETLEGRLRFLDYKTVRYQGHCEAMKLLLNELRLNERRDLLKDILETSVPMTLQDVVLIFATVTGTKNGRFTQESMARKIYGRTIGGREWSAIQVTTAAGICACVDLHRQGLLPARGFLRQEDVKLDDFLANRIGRYYEEGTA